MHDSDRQGLSLETIRERIILQVVALMPVAPAQPLNDNADVIHDLGLDSLKLVDLTVRLETTLPLDEFPMQEWVDDQLAAGRPLSLGELV